MTSFYYTDAPQIEESWEFWTDEDIQQFMQEKEDEEDTDH